MNHPWDSPTSNGPNSPDLSPSQVSPSRREWAEEQRRLDRAWYAQEETGDVFDETHNDMANLRGEYVSKKEEQVRSRETARQRERRRDTELWEENRMFVSGVMFCQEYGRLECSQRSPRTYRHPWLQK